jgi:nicotinamidase-related amidase
MERRRVVPMRRVRQVVGLALLGMSVLALAGQGLVFAQGTPADQLAVPEPAAVSVEPSSTAFLAIDFLQSTCAPNPSCMAALPAVAAGLTAARAANAHVVYSVHLAPDNNILPDVAPMPNDPVFAAVPGDKFFDSNLDYILRQAGISTLVLTGVSSNSGVMYTAAAATQRGYAVVVAEDGIAAATDFATSVALWQLLHGPGANPQNIPLQAKAITLSRTDLIAYK